MEFDPIASLRAAGVLGDTLRDHEQYYSSLSQEETALLIRLKDRLPSFLPEVQGHSADWARPEAAAPGVTAMDCMCGAWSGSGSGSSTPVLPGK